MAVFRRRDGRPAPAGPQRSGGRRQPSFLAREECAPAQGKKVGGAVAGTRPADARPAAKRGRLDGSGHSLPGENDAGSATQQQRTPAARSALHSTTKGATAGKPAMRCRSLRGILGSRFKRRAGKAGRHEAVHRISRRPAPKVAVYCVASASKEAINASGALNRPRRNAGGTTASTASSFSLGSIRR
jgi:hypothetical protein